MRKMKALVKYEDIDGASEIRDVDVPSLGDDDVLVRVSYIGVCGSDPHMHHSKVSYKLSLPLILGHEFAGIIETTGNNVKDFMPGDRVTCETHAEYCGICSMCRTNQYHLCKDRKGYGATINGAYAKYVKVPARILHRIPENVSLRDAAITEPLCVAYKAIVINSRVCPGDIVVVIGPGPIGILAMKMAQLCGASEIIAVGAYGDDKRLEMALHFGATIAIKSTDRDVSSVVKNLGDGYGADLVADAAGVTQTLALAMDVVRPGGQIIKVGWGPMPVGISLDPLLAKSVTLKGHFSHTWDVWEKCLRLMSKGQVNLGDIITHEMKLSEWEQSFRMVETKEAMKVVLYPDE